jgi:hypothetical protein
MATDIAADLAAADGSARSPVKAWLTAAPPRRSTATVILAMAAALLVVSAALHLDLWSSGYRAIPTIGPLFLAQGIATPAIALMLVATRWLVAILVALAAMVGTLGGFILASTVGLFGFHDGFAAPFASTTFVTEVAAVLLLLVGGMMVVRNAASATKTVSLSNRVDEIFDSVTDPGAAIDDYRTVRSSPDATAVGEHGSVRTAPNASWPPSR